MSDFEQAARMAGFTNFRRERGRYCHADLEIAYQWWMKGRLAQNPRH